jgi:hypothetical protein
MKKAGQLFPDKYRCDISSLVTRLTISKNKSEIQKSGFFYIMAAIASEMFRGAANTGLRAWLDHAIK